MQVSPSGVVNAYAASSSTAKSDGFTGAQAFTFGGGGVGGGSVGSAAAVPEPLIATAAAAPRTPIILLSTGTA